MARSSLDLPATMNITLSLSLSQWYPKKYNVAQLRDIYILVFMDNIYILGCSVDDSSYNTMVWFDKFLYKKKLDPRGYDGPRALF
jgi:hypothetical protein